MQRHTPMAEVKVPLIRPGSASNKGFGEPLVDHKFA
jgi:hypothetical protein